MPVPLDEMMRDVSPEERAEIEREAQKLVMISRAAQAEKRDKSVIARIHRHIATLAALGAGGASVFMTSAALLQAMASSLAPAIVALYFATLHRLAKMDTHEADFKDLVAQLEVLGQAVPSKIEAHHLPNYAESSAQGAFLGAELLNRRLQDIEFELKNLAKMESRLNEAPPSIALASSLRHSGIITEGEFQLFNTLRFATHSILEGQNSAEATQSDIARIADVGTKLITAWRERAHMGGAADRYSRDAG